jgi:nucleotide-binding universal stress UspA family protein
VIVPATDGTDKARDLTGLGSILVLCDFGPSSARAGRAAARLAATVGARLVLVHVMPSVSAPPSWSGHIEAAMEQRMADAHRQICGAMWPLEEHGPVESTIVRGNIPRRVAALVRTYHAGLIVIGLDADARGTHLGSTAYAVIAAASVPVLTVPASATESKGRPLEREVAAAAHR